MNCFARSASLRFALCFLAILTSTGVKGEAIAAQLLFSWADVSSNEEGFKVERKTGTGGTYVQIVVTPVNATTYLDSALSNSTQYCYRVRAYNAVGNSAYSNEACGTTAAPDTQPPVVSITAPGNGTMASGSAVVVSANATDNVGVVGVQFLLDDVNLGSEDTSAPYSVSWNTTTVTNGTHALKARARDAAGNQVTSAAVVVTVSNTVSQPGPTGLVAAYAFDENSGTTARDASGQANTGTVYGATWTRGKFGSALSFNGTNAWVTMPDTAALDLTTGITLEAWVYPIALSGGSTNGWRTVILKEAGSTAAYDLYANQETNAPSSYLSISGADYGIVGPSPLPLNTWTHLAATYDGARQRLFINGTQSAERAQTGAVLVSSGVLRVGGNSIWGEYFQGVIDNVRIYNRALTQTELLVNMSTPVTTASSPPPPPVTYTLTITKTGTGGGVVSASGISCGTDCAEPYPANTVVTLTATPTTGATFAGWSGDADCNDGVVTMTAAKTCMATFNLISLSRYTLIVNKAGTGSGVVSGTGINCGADCSEAYTSGTSVRLTATPAAGSSFVGWSGDGDCSDGTVTMSAGKTCIANFLRLLQVKVGVYRSSTATWYLDLNGNGRFDGCVTDTCSGTFGISTDRPIVGDWTAQGTAQLGTFDPTTALWELDRNGNDKWEGCAIDSCRGPFGQSGDQPVVGYWKAGMKTAGIGTYRSSIGRWFLDLNGNGLLDQGNTDARLGPFGAAADKPVVGNWAGNGISRIGVFIPSTGKWQLDLNGNGVFDGCTIDRCLGPFGITGDLPVAGDWTGTGRSQIGVFTPANGQWKLDVSGNGTFDGCTIDVCLGSFGQTGDLPVVGKW